MFGALGAIPVGSYRVIDRLHHNNLYGDVDPDIALHGGYPRGCAYLWKKLAQDAVGLNAWKTFAYFFGAPAINAATRGSLASFQSVMTIWILPPSPAAAPPGPRGRRAGS